jgi:hypothetical protein
MRNLRKRIRPRRVAEIVTACDTGLRGFPFEPQRQRIGRCAAFAKHLLHTYRRGLERDAIGGEVGEERGMHATLRAHSCERELGVDERAERDFFGVGLVRHRFKGTEQAGCADAQRGERAHDRRNVVVARLHRASSQSRSVGKRHRAKRHFSTAASV